MQLQSMGNPEFQRKWYLKFMRNFSQNCHHHFIRTRWHSDRGVKECALWLQRMVIFILQSSCTSIWFLIKSNFLLLDHFRFKIVYRLYYCHTGADYPISKLKLPKVNRPYWVPTSIGFGSLLYLTHWCFGEVSLLTRWTVKSYPDTGPSPYPWG